jgi:ABC-type sugar transport system ATPase subunit
MAELLAEGIGKVFPGGVHALQDVSFQVGAGQVLTLLGPSGCGKSTLLRIVAGLEDPDTGRLALDGRPLLGVAPGERHVGFVFQNYALYPHLDVRRNISLALQVRGLPGPEIEARVPRRRSSSGSPRSSTASRASSREASSSGWPSAAPWPGDRSST